MNYVTPSPLRKHETCTLFQAHGLHDFGRFNEDEKCAYCGITPAEYQKVLRDRYKRTTS